MMKLKNAESLQQKVYFFKFCYEKKNFKRSLLGAHLHLVRKLNLSIAFFVSLNFSIALLFQ